MPVGVGAGLGLGVAEGACTGDGVGLGEELMAAKKLSFGFTPAEVGLKSHPEKTSASAMIDPKPLWIGVPMVPIMKRKVEFENVSPETQAIRYVRGEPI